jgi:hypothetical protein
MSVDVDEEEVGLVGVVSLDNGSGDGKRLDPSHVDAEFFERRDRPAERAGLVGETDHDRGLVPAGSLFGTIADYGESGHIMRLVLDVFGENVQLVSRSGGTAGDCSGEFLALGDLGGSGCGNDLNRRRLRQILAEPVTALR